MTFGIAWAQTSATPPAGLPPATGGTSSGGFAALGFLVIAALLVILGVAVKIYDGRRKREAATTHLQAQISDALMRDARLAGLVLTPTARIRARRSRAAIVEISGEVSDWATHGTVLRVAREEAARLRSNVLIKDRLTMRRAVAA